MTVTTQSYVSSSYHPEYGYPDAFRLRVCKTAMSSGVSVASRKYKVCKASVYAWLKVFNYHQIMRG